MLPIHLPCIYAANVRFGSRDTRTPRKTLRVTLTTSRSAHAPPTHEIRELVHSAPWCATGRPPSERNPHTDMLRTDIQQNRRLYIPRALGIAPGVGHAPHHPPASGGCAREQCVLQRPPRWLAGQETASQPRDQLGRASFCVGTGDLPGARVRGAV